MRINNFQHQAIKTIFLDIFKIGEIYLFGSRVDDTKKGGDIDLYIKTPEKNLQRKKIKFLVKLKQIIGEQKIDVVFANKNKSFIDEIALKNAIKL